MSIYFCKAAARPILLALFWLLLIASATAAPDANANSQYAPAAQEPQGTIPVMPPVMAAEAPLLRQGRLECTDPVALTPWQLLVITSTTGSASAPDVDFARITFSNEHRCGGSGHIERIEGIDSLAILAHNIETPPNPGDPFDFAIAQPITVSPGSDYSVSGWMLSLCGGSAIPNDCPQGYYISKMLGLDPVGSNDPLSATVTWVEDRRNFADLNEEGQAVRWVNLYTAVTAQAPTMTVYARIRSPFRWHGNHAFIDAISVARAPTSYLADLPTIVETGTATITWRGTQSPDVLAIAGGTYQLLFDLQFRLAPDGPWRDWIVGMVGEGQAQFGPPCRGVSYEFRVRARAEQPAGGDGAWPNHRYPGVWGAPMTVTFSSLPVVAATMLPPPLNNGHQIFLPVVSNEVDCT